MNVNVFNTLLILLLSIIYCNHVKSVPIRLIAIEREVWMFPPTAVMPDSMSNLIKSNIISFGKILENNLTLTIPPVPTFVVTPEYGILNNDYLNIFIGDWAVLRRFGNVIQAFLKSPKKDTLRCVGRFKDEMSINTKTFGLGVPSVYCLTQRFGVHIAINMLTKAERKGLFKLPKLHNTEYVYGPEITYSVLEYVKMHPVVAENSFIEAGTTVGKWENNTVGGAGWMSMICFDILFPNIHEQSANFKNFFLSTAWTSTRDLHALAVQQAFSRALKVNLVASNSHVRNGHGKHTGSSIVRGGEVLAYHATEFTAGSPYSDPQYAFLQAEVDVAAEVPRYFMNDSYVFGRGEARHVLNIAANLTIKRLLTHVDLKQDQIIDFTLVSPAPHGDDLECRYVLKPMSTTIDADITYVAQAVYGAFGGRVVRSCSFFAVKSEFVDDHKKWDYYDVSFQHRFESIKIISNVGGSNVAALPLVALSLHGRPVPLPNITSDGEPTSTFLQSPDGKNLTLTVRIKTHGIQAASIYGVVGSRTSPLQESEISSVDGDAAVEAALRSSNKSGSKSDTSSGGSSEQRKTSVTSKDSKGDDNDSSESEQPSSPIDKWNKDVRLDHDEFLLKKRQELLSPI